MRTPSNIRATILRTVLCGAVALSITVLSMPMAAQDAAPDDAFWKHFDERYPQVAGQGPSLWDRAGKLAEVQHHDTTSEGYLAAQRIIFQALAVNELDRAIVNAGVKTPEDKARVEARRKAYYQFKEDVDTIEKLRAKPAGDLSQDDMTALMRATVSAMRYIYEARIEADEAYFESVVEENDRLQSKVNSESKGPVDPPTQPEAEDEPEGEQAMHGTYKAYLQGDRIRDNDEGYDRNNIRVMGAIKNITDKPSRYSFKIVALRSNGEAIGMKTVKTPVLQPNEVHEVDVRLAVTHSAYFRRVDMRDVHSSSK